MRKGEIKKFSYAQLNTKTKIMVSGTINLDKNIQFKQMHNQYYEILEMTQVFF